MQGTKEKDHPCSRAGSSRGRPGERGLAGQPTGVQADMAAPRECGNFITHAGYRQSAGNRSSTSAQTFRQVAGALVPDARSHNHPVLVTRIDFLSKDRLGYIAGIWQPSALGTITGRRGSAPLRNSRLSSTRFPSAVTLHGLSGRLEGLGGSLCLVARQRGGHGQLVAHQSVKADSGLGRLDGQGPMKLLWDAGHELA